uniref:DMAP1 domain-containing protein n=1 Tax=Macrostomum lignano TaxID=282301 RepID=A0A1I8JQM7_9PLAT
PTDPFRPIHELKARRAPVRPPPCRTTIEVVSPGNLQLLHAQFASLPEDSTRAVESPPPARRDQLAELDAGAPQRRAGGFEAPPRRIGRETAGTAGHAGARTPCCSAGWRTWRPSSRRRPRMRTTRLCARRSLHDRYQQLVKRLDQENKAKSKISMNYDELKFKLESIERAQSMADLSLSVTSPRGFSTLGGGPAFSGPEGRGGGSSGAEDSDSAAGSSLMSRSMYVPSSGGTSGGGGGSGGAARRRGLQHDRNKRRTISTAGDGGARDS